MHDLVRVAAVQAEPVWLNLEATTAKTVDLIAEAASGGAKLVGFPETWIPGYPVFLWSHPVFEQMEFRARYSANSMSIDSEEILRIRRTAREHSINVVVGFSEKAGGSLYLAQIVIDETGEIVFHRRKLKPTHVERTLFGESDGSGLKVVDTSVGRVGAMNCFEHLQPLSKYAMYAQNEQIHVAAWPCLGVMGNVPILSPDSIMGCTRTYAMEGGSFVISSSQIMSEDGAQMFPTANGEPSPVYTGGGGYARVYGPDSSLLTEPLEPSQEGIVYADLDLDAIDAAKQTVDPAGHYARPDVTKLFFNDGPQDPVTYHSQQGDRTTHTQLRDNADLTQQESEALAPASEQ